MDEFWNRFWYSLIKMSQKEMSNIDVFDLFLACVMAVIIVQLVGRIYTRLLDKERNIRMEIKVMLLIMAILLMWEIAVTGRDVMMERTVRTSLWWFGKNMDDNTANFLNVLFFIPFGILVTCVQSEDKRWRRLIMTPCYSFLMSLSIEITQYITARGYSEMIDLETNVFGGLVGAVLVLFTGRKAERKGNNGES